MIVRKILVLFFFGMIGVAVIVAVFTKETYKPRDYGSYTCTSGGLVQYDVRPLGYSLLVNNGPGRMHVSRMRIIACIDRLPALELPRGVVQEVLLTPGITVKEATVQLEEIIKADYGGKLLGQLRGLNTSVLVDFLNSNS